MTTPTQQMEGGAVQFRSAVVAEVDVAAREITVLAAPYERPTDIGGGVTETFSRGAFAGAATEPHRLGVWHDHGGPLVGRGVAVDDREDGIHIRARIASTDAAREMLTLVEEKILTDVSVEFRAMRGSMAVKDLGGGRLEVRHRKAVLRGFALTAEGAYGSGAYVESLRDAGRDREIEAAQAWLIAYRQQDPFRR